MAKPLKDRILNLIPESNRFELIWKLAQVDFKKRYYNDRLGLLWALLNPILRVTVYYYVFTIVFEVMTRGIENYGLFLFTGLIFWMFFIETSRKCLSIFKNKLYLILNIQVNVIDLFTSLGLASLFGFLFNVLALVLISVLVFGITYGTSILFLPILIITIWLIAMGFGMIISVINIYIKDISHLLDLVFLLGFWSSGIFFRGEEFIEKYPALMVLHPFVGLIINVRNALYYNKPIDVTLLAINLTQGIILYVIGLYLVNQHKHMAVEKL